MTLKPIPKWLETVIGYVFVVLFTPAFALIWLAEWWDRTFGPEIGEWQRWYAWTPTELGTWDGPVVWLEPVERARWGNAILYRRPGDTSVSAPWEMRGDD